MTIKNMKFMAILLFLYLTVASADRKLRFPADAYFEESMASMCVSTPKTVRAVFENHFIQLNNCNLTGLKKERSPATQLFFGGSLIKGEQAVDNVFSGFCKQRSDGGLNGITFEEKESFIVGNVISVLWEATAPFLAKPYPGSDAYVTCGRKMLTIVSSFDSSELVFKKGK